MFHYGSKPTSNIKEDIVNLNQLIKNIVQFPKPIININNLYNDCFEISMLRFMHIIIGSDNNISLNKLKYIIGDTYTNNKLYDFFSIYNKYNNTIDLEERMNWYNMLNSIGCCKMNPPIDNLIIFLETFFPRIMSGNSDQVKITQLLSSLAINNNFYIKVYKNGSIYQDKIYEEFTIKIFINNNNMYDWQFYQYYENINDLKGQFITGYTELKYSKYIVSGCLTTKRRRNSVNFL